MSLNWKTAALAMVLALGAVSLQGCGRRFGPEPSCDFVQNGFKQRVSWKQYVPIRMYVHASVPQQYHQAIIEAAREWNRIFGKALILIEGFNTTGPSAPQRDGYSVIYWLQSWEISKDNEQGRTTVYWSGARIYEADIRINGLKAFTTDVVAQPGNVDFKSLMVHELGHALGLAHTKAAGSVMAVSLGEGARRDQVETVDRNSILCEYKEMVL